MSEKKSVGLPEMGNEQAHNALQIMKIVSEAGALPAQEMQIYLAQAQIHATLAVAWELKTANMIAAGEAFSLTNPEIAQRLR